jgi:FtsP/CotA-like multicopper oxidase with cupredoxin domain
MSKSQKIVITICIFSIITIILVASSFIQIKIIAENNTPEKKIEIGTGGHGSVGYRSINTSGDILNSVNEDDYLSNNNLNPMEYLRDFNYGHVSKTENGSTIREFTLIAQDKKLEVSPGVIMDAWTFNGTVPGPTIRATEGDTIRINFINNGSQPHSIHTHGIHPAQMDGVFEMVAPKGKFTYEFIAKPFGVFPYHCHMQPLEEHINRGLYGVYIVDPKIPRPPADEMVMMMNGYDTDFDAENNFYTVNGLPYYYMNNPIEIEKDKPIRIYLVNMLEFDQINNFHLHANMFNYYPSGTMLEPNQYNDIVTLSQGDRGIVEFNYTYPGKYMFHAHKTEFAEKGWMGTFLVKDNARKSDLTASDKGEKIGYNTGQEKNFNSNTNTISELNNQTRREGGNLHR